MNDALAELPGLVRAHLLLSGCAVLLAVLIGLPLALLAAESRRLRGPLLGAIALVQTIPALALLALFYPLLLAIGRGVPALGFLPALMALTVYALLPIVRNAVAARQGLDPAVIEAADGVGMTRWQRLRLVELPLGLPVILAGIRTATVWTIGTATLATTVGAPSLGNLIFSGLQTENWPRVLVGCAAAAALALAAEAILSLLESGAARRSRTRLWLGAGLLIAGIALALWPASAGRGDVVIVGAKNFAEQYILAGAIEDRLERVGYRVERRDDLGSAVAYRALAAGDIDVYVDYTGTLWTNVLGRADTPPAPVMRQVLTDELAKRDHVRLLGALGFENAYAFAMKRARAEELGIRDLSDLSHQASRLSLASDIEFLSRPEWRAVAAAYGLRFREQRPYNPTFMYRAVSDGSADVISAFSSDGRIASLDLVTLADPKGALPNYDAVLLVSPKRAREQAFTAALQPLIGSIPIDRMRRANLMVDGEGRSPARAAAWLTQTVASR